MLLAVQMMMRLGLPTNRLGVFAVMRILLFLTSSRIVGSFTSSRNTFPLTTSTDPKRELLRSRVVLRSLKSWSRDFGDSALRQVQVLASTVAASGNSTVPEKTEPASVMRPQMLTPLSNRSDAQVWLALENLEQDSKLLIASRTVVANFA